MIRVERWQVILILIVSLLGPLYAFPNLISEERREAWAEKFPSIIPHKAMSLGLDLQGGSHLQLQADMDAVLSDRVNSLAASVRGLARTERVRLNQVRQDRNSVAFALADEAETKGFISKLRREVGEGIDITQENGRYVARYRETELIAMRRHTIQQSIEIIRRRIDETGTKEPVIQQQGDDRIIVQLPGMKDPERMKELLGKTAQMTFHLVDVDTTCGAGTVSLSVRCLPVKDFGGQKLAIRRRSLLTGDMLVDAQPGFGMNGQAVVNFKFNSLGARKFAQVTKDNVGNPFAIVLDDEIITAPNITEPITGGSGQISGSFTTQTANDLAILLRAGALPAPLKVVEERTVGPSLGADSISSGKNASIVATVIVILFMFVVYGRTFGFFANVALVVNVLMMIAILSVMGATLTLPGIVGIVLSIGMAVDANVLIYERMREEKQAGRSVMAAIDHGYRGSMSSIIDANVTSLISALVLYALGTGPVRGFAVTLGIGIITSMFAAIYLTRVMITLWLQWRQPKTLPL
jgi:preprotein translocase subunit SecD